ncbi:hypothetical protein KIPB_008672 [Kipferlia bialata]|uniref:Uncharacterized protein n=1 Tax=Kipferlia bialata TaxID=797122 RepID=A0A9K3GLM6_9EUKA|nr:hypothetical protein KIPB_008672 [Kipferlia bialata]|eukprot:g8672.t1
MSCCSDDVYVEMQTNLLEVRLEAQQYLDMFSAPDYADYVSRVQEAEWCSGNSDADDAVCSALQTVQSLKDQYYPEVGYRLKGCFETILEQYVGLSCLMCDPSMHSYTTEDGTVLVDKDMGPDLIEECVPAFEALFDMLQEALPYQRQAVCAMHAGEGCDSDTIADRVTCPFLPVCEWSDAGEVWANRALSSLTYDLPCAMRTVMTLFMEGYAGMEGFWTCLVHDADTVPEFPAFPSLPMSSCEAELTLFSAKGGVDIAKLGRKASLPASLSASKPMAWWDYALYGLLGVGVTVVMGGLGYYVVHTRTLTPQKRAPSFAFPAHRAAMPSPTPM